jgi:8-amino-7-oxononanoate synthase
MEDLNSMHDAQNALSWMDDELRQLDAQGLRRRLTTIEDRRPGEICVDGRWLHDFTGNDYLGLTLHPECVLASQRALERGGCGSGGSRVVTGGVPPHGELEQLLHSVTGRSCIVFPSGYQANLGVLSALGSEDTIFSDAQNHASIVDGCRLSKAAVRIYPHGRWDVLERWLSEPSPGRRWIVTDTVFSMDGSLAPVGELARLAQAHGAPLLVDEAHAMGVLGDGLGLCAAHGVTPQLLMGTFSKGLGSHGAFVATTEPMAQWLINRARAFIYTTALPPAVLGASAKGLAISLSAEGDTLRKNVLGLAHRLRLHLQRAGLEPSGEGTPIVSLQFDETTRATQIQEHLSQAGHLAWAFRPPTVPKGSRLRISLSASHQPAAVDRLGQALVTALNDQAPRNHV